MADMKLDMLLQVVDKASPELKRFQNNVSNVGSKLKRFAAVAGGLFAGGSFLKSVFDVNAQFQDLEAQLQTVTGSAAEAGEAFKFLTQLSTKMPESIQDVTQAFIKMKALGLSPTAEALTAFGDIAAATGTGIMQFVEAVADASTGEFERLKAFGITTKSQGDKVAFTFRGLTTTIGKNSKEITKYLEDLGRTNFGGAMEKKMQTLGGAVTNIGVAWEGLLARFGKGGLNNLFADGLRAVEQAIKDITNNLLELQIVGLAVFKALGVSAINMKAGLKAVASIIGTTITNALIIAHNTWNDFVSGFAKYANILSNLAGNGDMFAISPGATLSLKNYGDEMLNIANEREAELIALEKANQGYLDNAIAVDQAAKSESGYAEELADRKEVEQQTTDAANQAREAEERRLAVFNKLTKEIKDQRDATISANYAADILKKQLEAGTITADEYAIALEKIEKILKDNIPAGAENTKSTLENLKDHVKVAAQAMESSMSDLFFDVMQGNMNDFASNFKRIIDRMVADFITSEIFKYLVGGYTSTGKLGSDSFFGQMFAGREQGGPVTRGTPYIVGERRPEIFVPEVNGRILPNADKTLSSIRPSEQQSVNITIQAMDSQDVRRAFERDKRWLSDLLTNTNRNYNLS